MSFTGLYLHFVWATKYRYPFLTTEDIRNRLWEHIEAYAESKGIHVLAVGGYDDHCHCLVSLHAEQSASKIAGLLKGESSYWINKSGLIRDVSKREKFNWQEKYFVESISPNDLRNVIHYIQIQEEHHQKISFLEEVENFPSEEKIHLLIAK